MKRNLPGHANTSDPDLLNHPSPVRSGLTVRSVVLGLTGVAFIAAYSPYNDFYLGNTYFIGNQFPIGVTLLMCLLILVLNPLLRWWRPASALRSTELITIWGMCLIGAAFPTTGLLRQLIPWLVSPFYLLPEHPHWESILEFLPSWLSPIQRTSPSILESVLDPANDQIINTFFLGTEEGQPQTVPWSAWIKPLGWWSLYYVPLFIGILLLSVLMSRQWIVYEKLPYPIATVMLEMVRDAPPGRRLNALFSSRPMWVAAGMVAAIYTVNGLRACFFRDIPEIKLSFNLDSVATEGIWAQTIWYMKQGRIYFSMIGIAFLMAAEASLSLWFFLVLFGLIITFFGYEHTWEALRSQNYGAILGMGGYILFIARAHLWRAIRTAFSPSSARRDTAYSAYRWVIWGLMLCIALCIAWLCAIGLPWPLAIAQIVILYVIYLVMSRLVAETGMFYVSPRMWSNYLFPLLLPNVISAKSQALVVSSAWPAYQSRETLMPLAFNAMRLTHGFDQLKQDDSRVKPAVHSSYVGAMLAAIFLSLLIATATWLLLYYNHGAIRVNTSTAVNQCTIKFNEIFQYAQGVPPLPGQGPTHMAIGALLILVLAFCRLRFPRWPLVPVALCMATTDMLGYMWISIFVGWLCKTCVMKAGGVTIYNRARPLALGLVIGEILMAGAWMTVGAIMSLSGYEVPTFRILPQ